MRHLLLSLPFCLAAVANCQAAERWDALKPGLTQEEATNLLGAPLLASRGRGFDVANYDQRGEVVFLAGRLVAWSTPAKAPVNPSPVGTWAFVQQPVRLPKPVFAARQPVAEQRAAVMPSYRWR